MEIQEKVEAFANRKYLVQKKLVRYYKDEYWPFIQIEDPVVLARFVSFIKQAVCRKDDTGWVFFRGQCKYHNSMIPSLFRRSKNIITINSLVKAQDALMDKIRKNFDVKRFQHDYLPSLLQHYGIKTSWLDLVDNLYIAIWFASNKTTQNGERVGRIITENSKEKYGWIYLIANHDFKGSNLKSIDLRTNHHSLSVRPHAQHGISVTRSNHSWNDANIDLKDFVVATVRFPLSKKWHVSGYIASSSYLFPSPYFDNTLKVLKNKKMSRIISEVESDFVLPKGTLGCINWV